MLTKPLTNSELTAEIARITSLDISPEHKATMTTALLHRTMDERTRYHAALLPRFSRYARAAVTAVVIELCSIITVECAPGMTSPYSDACALTGTIAFLAALGFGIVYATRTLSLWRELRRFTL